MINILSKKLQLDQLLVLYVILTVMLSPYFLLYKSENCWGAAVISIIVLFFFTSIKKYYYFLIILSGAFLLSGSVFDLSCDGRIHLQEPIIQLSHGWNFFKHDFPDFLSWWGAKWINFYPLGMQFYGSAVYSLLGNIQTAKSIHILLWISNVILSYRTFRERYNSNTFSFVCAFLVSTNPLFIQQFMSFYVDDLVYSCFLYSFLSFSHNGFRKKSSLVSNTSNDNIYTLFGIVTLLLCLSLKITGVIASAILFITFFSKIIKHKLFLILCLVIMFPLIYIPYCKYLFLLPEIIKNGENRLPGNLYDINIIGKYFFSLFSETAESYVYLELGFINKLFQYSFQRYDFSFGLYDLWWNILFIGLIIFSLYRKLFSQLSVYCKIIASIIIICPIIYEGFLNQRYYSYLYMVPFVFLLCFCSELKLRRWMFFSIVLLCLGMSIDYSIKFYATFKEYLIFTRNIREQVEFVENQSTENVVFYKLDNDKYLGNDWTKNTYSDRLFFANPNLYFDSHNYNLNNSSLKEILRTPLVNDFSSIQLNKYSKTSCYYQVELNDCTNELSYNAEIFYPTYTYLRKSDYLDTVFLIGGTSKELKLKFISGSCKSMVIKQGNIEQLMSSSAINLSKRHMNY